MARHMGDAAPRCFGASFKAGNYRSAQNYFDDAFRHQEVHCSWRSTPGKEVAHMTDVVIIAAWFMLKEIELGSTLVRDLGLTATHVIIDVPLHKTAPGGECVMTPPAGVCMRRAGTAAVSISRSPTSPATAASQGVRGTRRPAPAGAGRRIHAEARRDPQVLAGTTGGGRRANVHRPQRQAAATLRRSRGPRRRRVLPSRPRRPHAGYSAAWAVDLPSGGEVHPECSAGVVAGCGGRGLR